MMGQNKAIVLFYTGLFVLALALPVFAYEYTSGGTETTDNCIRQEITRIVAPAESYYINAYENGSIAGPEKPSGNIQFVYTVPTGSIFYFRGLRSILFASDSQPEGINWINYVDMFNNTTGEILATAGLNYEGGPINQETNLEPFRYCVTASDSATICYKNNGVYFPAKGTCSASNIIIVGGGALGDDFQKPDGGIGYIFKNAGEYDISLRLGTISPNGVSRYSPYIMHTDITRGKIFVEDPSMDIIAPLIKRVNSFNNSGTTTEEIFFTLKNTSHYIEKIENYSLDCPSGVTCGVTDTYKGFTISPNQSMIIPATVTLNFSGIPKTISGIKLNVNYSATALAKSSFNDSSNEVSFQVGFLDKQDFQIEVIASEEESYCIADDGTIGKTGEIVYPRINLYFGRKNAPESEVIGGDRDEYGCLTAAGYTWCEDKNKCLQTWEEPCNNEGSNTKSTAGTVVVNEKLISIDECSPENPDWVYCSQREFLVQLSEKLEKIEGVRLALNKAQQDLYLYQSTNNQAKIDETNTKIASLMKEDSNLSAFSAYLRKQNIDSTTINNSLAKIQYIPFVNVGFYGFSKIKFDALMKSIAYEKTGSASDKALESGLYNVKISTALTGEINYSDNYLFLPSGELNPLINITVSLEKKSNPSYNWFFYEDDSTDSFAEKMELVNQVPTAYASNVQDRGLVMDFSRNESVINYNKFYKTYAIPLFIKVTGQGNGVSDASFTTTNYSGDTFTYWSGFASTLENGCVTTSASPPGGVKTLPYRVPDTLSGTNYVIPELWKDESNGGVVDNNSMYLETVVYLPEEVQVILAGHKFYINSVPAGSDNLTLKPAVSIHKAYSVAEVFDKIKSEEICVANEKISSSSEKWVLFWNQQKILQDLDAMKDTITDARLCEIRETLSS